jgi:hypothetical protein
MVQYKQPYWNFFAEELQNVLRVHGIGLDRLNDNASIDIEPEKIRELQQSLYLPPDLPVLNREEMQQVINAFHLTEEDDLHLRAALITTDFQRMLCERLSFERARAVAELLPARLYEAFLAELDERELGNRRGDISAADDRDLDNIFSAVRAAFHRGEKTLQFSYDVASHHTRVRYARHAQHDFATALSVLQTLHPNIQRLPFWQQWHKRVQKGLSATSARLEELGERVR